MRKLFSLRARIAAFVILPVTAVALASALIWLPWTKALTLAAAMLLLAGPVVWVAIGHALAPLASLQARIVALRSEPTQALAPPHDGSDEIDGLAQEFDALMRERLYAEARHQASAEELRTATNAGLDAFFIFQAERDADGRIRDFRVRYANLIAEKLLDLPREAVLQQSLLQDLAAQPMAGLFARFVHAMNDRLPLQEELRVAAGTGNDSDRSSWYQIQIVPQADGVALTLRDITRRKRDELEIRTNRAFLQSLTDHLPMMFYAKRIRADGQGEFVSWNAAAEAMTGMPASEVLGRTDRDLHPAKLAAVYEAHDRGMLDNPVPVDVPETRFHRRDGTVRYIHIMSVPIVDDRGRVDTIIGIGEDITERRLQERNLRTNRAQLQAVNDASPLGLFMTDVAGNCLYVNRTFELLCGVEAAELMGDAWLRSLHPQDQDAAIDGWIDAISRHQPYEGVHRFLRKDGAVVWGSFKAVPMLVDDLVGGYVGSVDDITARRQVEDALHASDQRLRLLTDNIPALIGYVTPARRFEFGNRRYQPAFALTDPDVAGRPIAEVLGADVYAQSAPYIDGALHGTPATFERLVTHVRQLRWERVNYIPDVDETGQVHGFFSLVEDITELKQAQHTFAKSEMRLRMITDNLPALIAYIDRDCRYRFCNGYYENIVGMKPEKILGRKVEEVVGGRGFHAVASYMQQVLAGERVSFERHVVAEGIDRHFSYDYIPDVGMDGSVVGFYSMILDISERKNAELKQAAGERLLRTLTDNLPALVAFIDTEERFRFNNKVYPEWLGKPLADISGHSMREVYGEKNYQLYKSYFDQALQGARVEFEFEAPRNGEPHFFRATYSPQVDANGGINGVCSMISDITALKKVENQLRVLARFDSLTGLPNRNQFEEKLAEAIARSSRTKRAMAVMFLDIDHFKDINDTIGHHAGDAVLREFAQRLQRCVRKTDTVSRLAGDEFTIILEGLQIEGETAIVAEKIINAMREEFSIGEERRTVTTSIGIAVRRTDEISAETLLRRADEALYEAKAAGRNTFGILV